MYSVIDETKMPVFEADNDDFTSTLFNLNYGHDYVMNVNDTRNGTQGGTQDGTQDKLQKQIFDMIEENPQISTSEIATKLGVGVRTAWVVIMYQKSSWYFLLNYIQ